MKKFLIIEYTDFMGYPGGGQAQQALYLAKMFSDQVALVGISNNKMQVGQWAKKEIFGSFIDFFSVSIKDLEHNSSIIPIRLKFFMKLKRYRKKIESLGINYMITQSPDVILATRKWNFSNICYWSPGVSNPLISSRYSWGKLLANTYEKALFDALGKVDVILASADEKRIAKFIKRSHGKINRNKVIKFPTRLDTSHFKPADNKNKKKVIPEIPKFVVLGRLSKVKGWSLILESFRIFINRYKGAKLFFVGDGEDRFKIKDRIIKLGLAEHVILTGLLSKSDVLKHLQTADLVLFGSLGEGWSVAMLEAIACGKPIVTTDVSGSAEMVIEGHNGYILRKRDPDKFADYIYKALNLVNAEEKSRKLALNYNLESLKKDLTYYWVKYR